MILHFVLILKDLNIALKNIVFQIHPICLKQNTKETVCLNLEALRNVIEQDENINEEHEYKIRIQSVICDSFSLFHCSRLN